MPETSLWLWAGFNLFILAMLALDLGVFHRKAHEVSIKEATTWSAVWISLAMIFNAGLWYFRGAEPAIEFFTGYLIEKSLSVDNIFVFALIFSYFAVPPAWQHRVLFWGILGALILRAAFIFAGAALLAQFHWVIYVFGAFLIFTGVRMALLRNTEMDPGKNPVLKLVRKLIPVTSDFRGDHFFARDSIPAIFAVTDDPFIVYTSNVFAILGLRSLYFLLAGVMGKFHYLKLGLSGVLVFVGVKMVLMDFYKIPSPISLAVIAAILTMSIVASLRKAKREELEAAASVQVLEKTPAP
jgi:tellurite resistance protein TerC